MFQLKLIVCFLGLWVIIGISAYNYDVNRTLWDKEEYPNPQVDLDSCGRGERKSWVCDPSKMITTLEANIIDQLIESTREESDCACKDCNKERDDGYKVAVALVPGISKNGRSVHDDSKSQRESAAYDFATYLRTRKWKYEECEDGVVVIISKQEKVLKFSVGETARKQLSEDCENDILRENSGKISRGDNGKALKNAVSQLRTVFKGTHPCKDNGFRWYYVVGPVMVVIAILIYLLVCCCRGGSRGDCDGDFLCAICGNS